MATAECIELIGIVKEQECKIKALSKILISNQQRLEEGERELKTIKQANMNVDVEGKNAQGDERKKTQKNTPNDPQSLIFTA